MELSLKRTFINPKSRRASVFSCRSGALFSDLNQSQKYIIHGYSKGIVNHLHFLFLRGCHYSSSVSLFLYLPIHTYSYVKGTDVPVSTILCLYRSNLTCVTVF